MPATGMQSGEEVNLELNPSVSLPPLIDITSDHSVPSSSSCRHIEAWTATTRLPSTGWPSASPLDTEGASHWRYIEEFLQHIIYYSRNHLLLLREAHEWSSMQSCAPSSLPPPRSPAWDRLLLRWHLRVPLEVCLVGPRFLAAPAHEEKALASVSHPIPTSSLQASQADTPPLPPLFKKGNEDKVDPNHPPLQWLFLEEAEGFTLRDQCYLYRTALPDYIQVTTKEPPAAPEVDPHCSRAPPPPASATLHEPFPAELVYRVWKELWMLFGAMHRQQGLLYPPGLHTPPHTKKCDALEGGEEDAHGFTPSPPPALFCVPSGVLRQVLPRVSGDDPSYWEEEVHTQLQWYEALHAGFTSSRSPWGARPEHRHRYRGGGGLGSGSGASSCSGGQTASVVGRVVLEPVQILQEDDEEEEDVAVEDGPTGGPAVGPYTSADVGVSFSPDHPSFFSSFSSRSTAHYSLQHWLHPLLFGSLHIRGENTAVDPVTALFGDAFPIKTSNELVSVAQVDQLRAWCQQVEQHLHTLIPYLAPHHYASLRSTLAAIRGDLSRAAPLPSPSSREDVGTAAGSAFNDRVKSPELSFSSVSPSPRNPGPELATFTPFSPQIPSPAPPPPPLIRLSPSILQWQLTIRHHLLHSPEDGGWNAAVLGLEAALSGFDLLRDSCLAIHLASLSPTLSPSSSHATVYERVVSALEKIFVSTRGPAEARMVAQNFLYATFHDLIHAALPSLQSGTVPHWVATSATPSVRSSTRPSPAQLAIDWLRYLHAAYPPSHVLTSTGLERFFAPSLAQCLIEMMEGENHIHGPLCWSGAWRRRAFHRTHVPAKTPIQKEEGKSSAKGALTAPEPPASPLAALVRLRTTALRFPILHDTLQLRHPHRCLADETVQLWALLYRGWDLFVNSGDRDADAAAGVAAGAPSSFRVPPAPATPMLLLTSLKSGRTHLDTRAFLERRWRWRRWLALWLWMAAGAAAPAGALVGTAVLAAPPSCPPRQPGWASMIDAFLPSHFPTSSSSLSQPSQPCWFPSGCRLQRFPVHLWHALLAKWCEAIKREKDALGGHAVPDEAQHCSRMVSPRLQRVSPTATLSWSSSAEGMYVMFLRRLLVLQRTLSAASRDAPGGPSSATAACFQRPSPLTWEKVALLRHAILHYPHPPGSQLPRIPTCLRLEIWSVLLGLPTREVQEFNYEALHQARERMLSVPPSTPRALRTCLKKQSIDPEKPAKRVQIITAVEEEDDDHAAVKESPMAARRRVLLEQEKQLRIDLPRCRGDPVLSSPSFQTALLRVLQCFIVSRYAGRGEKALTSEKMVTAAVSSSQTRPARSSSSEGFKSVYYQGLDRLCGHLLRVTSPAGEPHAYALLDSIVQGYIAYDIQRRTTGEGLEEQPSTTQHYPPAASGPAAEGTPPHHFSHAASHNGPNPGALTRVSIADQLGRLGAVLSYEDPVLLSHLLHPVLREQKRKHRTQARKRGTMDEESDDAVIDEQGLTPDLFSVSWFLTLFTHNLPVEKSLQIWDFLFLHSPPLSYLRIGGFSEVVKHTPGVFSEGDSGSALGRPAAASRWASTFFAQLTSHDRDIAGFAGACANAEPIYPHCLVCLCAAMVILHRQVLLETTSFDALLTTLNEKVANVSVEALFALTWKLLEHLPCSVALQPYSESEAALLVKPEAGHLPSKVSKRKKKPSSHAVELSSETPASLDLSQPPLYPNLMWKRTLSETEAAAAASGHSASEPTALYRPCVPFISVWELYSLWKNFVSWQSHTAARLQRTHSWKPSVEEEGEAGGVAKKYFPGLWLIDARTIPTHPSSPVQSAGSEGAKAASHPVRALDSPTSKTAVVPPKTTMPIDVGSSSSSSSSRSSSAEARGSVLSEKPSITHPPPSSSSPPPSAHGSSCRCAVCGRISGAVRLRFLSIFDHSSVEDACLELLQLLPLTHLARIPSFNAAAAEDYSVLASSETTKSLPHPRSPHIVFVLSSNRSTTLSEALLHREEKVVLAVIRRLQERYQLPRLSVVRGGAEALYAVFPQWFLPHRL